MRIIDPLVLVSAILRLNLGLRLSVSLRRLGIALHLRLLPAGVTARSLHAALQARYQGQPCIELQPLEEDADAQRLDPRALNGSNRMRLAVFGQPQEQQVLLTAVFDNLGKGAAGAAVQNLDLMLGLQPMLHGSTNPSRIPLPL